MLAGVAVAIASSACPGRTERAAPETSVEHIQPGSPVTGEVTLTPTALAMEESSATFEVPVAPPTEVRRPYEPAPVVADRPADSPQRCLSVRASPNFASAYGRAGEVVQLVVRIQNACGTNFDGASFRVTAIGADGSVGSASGRFSSPIPAGGSAETLVAIPARASAVLTYRAEVTGY
jgi:hypothetical protein